MTEYARPWKLVTVLAVVLSSNFFLPVSCTGGVVIGVKLNERLLRDAAGQQGPDGRMMVMAIAPDSKEPGKAVTHQVKLAKLDEFKTRHIGYSFLIPPGSGSVNDVLAEVHTRYTAR